MQGPFETCPICGGRVEVRTADREIHVGKRTARLQIEAATCVDCGEYFVSPNEMDEVQIRASELIRKEEGLLFPERIARIRKKLGLSQSQFERLLGVGPKTVVRWERGTVFQNSATDNLLRVLDSVPEAVAFLAERQGVALPQSASQTLESVDVRHTERIYTYAERKIALRVVGVSGLSSRGSAAASDVILSIESAMRLVG